MLKRVLGIAAALTLALTGGVASARDDRIGKEMNQDTMSLDQQHRRVLTTDEPSGDLGQSSPWGGDEASAASQNHSPDWKRPAPRAVRVTDTPVTGDTETSSEALHPEFEPDTGDAGVADQQPSQDSSSKKTSSLDMNKATPHLALLDAYLDSAAANAKVLSSLTDQSKSSHAREAKKNLELSLSKAIEHANQLSSMDLDTKDLVSHLRQAKRSLSSSSSSSSASDLSGHLSAAESSFQSLAEGASYAASDSSFCGDRQPVSGHDEDLDIDANESNMERHPSPIDIDQDSIPGDDSIPGAENKQHLPPPARPDAPVGDDASK